MQDCLFCKIVKGEIPCHKIYEDDDVLAFLDITNDPEGHTLVIPKKHSNNLFDISEEEYQKVQKAVLKISKHYKEIGFAEGINTYINCEECAGQIVPHFHEHIIPRTKDDGIKMEKTEKVSTKDLSVVCEKIKLN